MWGLVVGMAGVWVYVHLCCTVVGDVRIRMYIGDYLCAW